jgi:O-antigen/teichoic acid export membrane protein
MDNNEYKIGAILSYLSIFIGNTVGIIYTPIMLRMLGQEEYGLYSLVGSTIATMSIVDLGFGNACIRYISKYRALGDRDKEYRVNGMFTVINIGICLLTCLIGLILYYFSNSLFNNSLTLNQLNKFKLMLLILIFNLAISFPFSVFGSIIVSYEKFIFPKIIGIVRTIINPIVILGILYLGSDSLGMVIANTVINILFLWVNAYYCFNKLNIKVYFKGFDFALLKEISIYSFFIFLAIIVDKIYWNTDQFILGIYSGTVMISIYAIASQLNMYYMQFSTAISTMFLPKVTTMVIKDSSNHELTNLFIKIGRIQFLILGLILSGFILFGKEFITIWAGREYKDAYYMALILITPFTIPLIQNIGLTILQAKNKNVFRSTVLIFIAIGNFLISIPLAQRFGGIGCAIGTSIAMILGNILIMNIYYYKKININILRFWVEIAFLCIPMIVSLGIGIILNMIFQESGILQLSVKIIIFTVAYVFIIYFFGMNKYEKTLFFSQFSEMTKRIKRRETEVPKGLN